VAAGKFAAAGLDVTVPRASSSLPFVEVVRACTETPARIMRMEGEIGTLQAGAFADICIMKREARAITLADFYGNTVIGDTVLLPQMTIKAGRTKYCHMDFVLRP
jgi:dihydroorotase